MRLLLLIFACCGVQGAELDPAEIVRRVVQNDELRDSDPARAYTMVERAKTENLDEDRRVKSVATKTREIRLADYQKRRERFRKAIREIPDAFQYRLSGEQEIDERPCYVIEASPKQGYDPVDRYSRLFTQVKGKLWVDKAELRWVKLEVELIDTVTFGWILVRIHKGSQARMEQRLVNGEAWLPAQLWYRVSLRIGLVSFRGQVNESFYGDYKREDPALPPPVPSSSR